VSRGDVARLADALRTPPHVAAAAVHRAHHARRAERGGVAALLVEDPEQPVALGALRPHPAELDPDARDGEPARPNRRDHRVRRPARLGRAREVEPAQLDRVPSGRPRDPQHVLERGGVERPGMQGERIRHAHGVASSRRSRSNARASSS
jgi:hypothetical protein